MTVGVDDDDYVDAGYSDNESDNEDEDGDDDFNNNENVAYKSNLRFQKSNMSIFKTSSPSRKRRARKPLDIRAPKKPKNIIECSCPAAPVGPSLEWKQEIDNAEKDQYNRDQQVTLLGGTAWGGFQCCKNHLRALESFLGFSKQSDIRITEINLKQFWDARKDLDE